MPADPSVAPRPITAAPMTPATRSGEPATAVTPDRDQPDPVAALRERAERRAQVDPPAVAPSWTQARPSSATPSGVSPSGLSGPGAAEPASPRPFAPLPDRAPPAGSFSSSFTGSFADAPPTPVTPPSIGPVPARLALIAAGAVAILFLVVIGFVVLRPAPAPEPGPIAGDILGTCFTYTADRSQVGTVVPCEQPHDAKVLASTADQAACPAGTTDILTTATDTKGTAGVLCVAKST